VTIDMCFPLPRSECRFSVTTASNQNMPLVDHGPKPHMPHTHLVASTISKASVLCHACADIWASGWHGRTGKLEQHSQSSSQACIQHGFNADVVPHSTQSGMHNCRFGAQFIVLPMKWVYANHHKHLRWTSAGWDGLCCSSLFFRNKPCC
jgi:hypothetical protein